MFFLLLPAPALAYEISYTSNKPVLDLPAGPSIVVPTGNGATVTFQVTHEGAPVAHARLLHTVDGLESGTSSTNAQGTAVLGYYNGGAQAARQATTQLDCVLVGDVCEPASASPLTFGVMFTDAAVGLSVPAQAFTGTTVQIIAFVNWTANQAPIGGLRVRITVDGTTAYSTTDANGRATFQIVQQTPKQRHVQAGVEFIDYPAGVPTAPSPIKTIRFVSPGAPPPPPPADETSPPPEPQPEPSSSNPAPTSEPAPSSEPGPSSEPSSSSPPASPSSEPTSSSPSPSAVATNPGTPDLVVIGDGTVPAGSSTPSSTSPAGGDQGTPAPAAAWLIFMLASLLVRWRRLA